MGLPYYSIAHSTDWKIRHVFSQVHALSIIQLLIRWRHPKWPMRSHEILRHFFCRHCLPNKMPAITHEILPQLPISLHWRGVASDHKWPCPYHDMGTVRTVSILAPAAMMCRNCLGYKRYQLHPSHPNGRFDGLAQDCIDNTRGTTVLH